MEDLVITVLGVMLLLGSVSLLLPLAQRLNIPYTVLLALVGIVLGAFVGFYQPTESPGPIDDIARALGGLKITHDVVFFIFLPTLIFESAFAINIHRLMDDIAPILLLAVVGLLMSTFAVGYAMWAVSGFTILICLLLGAIVSATDPVAVVALFRDLGAPKRLTILVEGESLFNDATAIVLFTILSSMILIGGQFDLFDGAWSFIVIFCGGAAVGAACAFVICALIGRIRDAELVEITLTIALAYLVFILAEHYLHVSGVMAVVAAALVVNSYGRTQISPDAWSSLLHTWEQLAFWANSLIFVLVGLAVPRLLLQDPTSDVTALWPLAVLIGVAILARAAMFFVLLPLFSMIGLTAPVQPAYGAVMLWGGLRGAVSLALALVVLESPAFETADKNFIVVMVTGFVLFTLLVKATTMRPLLGLFGLAQLPEAERAVRNRALTLSLSHIRQVIDRVADSYDIEPNVARTVAQEYDQRLEALGDDFEHMEGLSRENQVQIGINALIDHERDLYLKYFAERLMPSRIARGLLNENERLLDSVKTAGIAGYDAALTRSLGFSWEFRLALALHRRFGLVRPLAYTLAKRFEKLLISTNVLRELTTYCEEIIGSLVGPEAKLEIEALLIRRRQETEKAMAALKLQYPEYAEALKRRFLGRLALRLEEVNYHKMLEESAVSREVFNDLLQRWRERSEHLEQQPTLDLGLDPESLLAKVDLFADLSAERIAEMAKLLKPRLILPGETIVRKGEVGDAMYFIHSGAIEVKLDPEPVHLGSGDFFGEIALVKDVRRTADVVALGYCRCLVLPVRDFREFLEADAELRATIQRVAEARHDSQQALGIDQAIDGGKSS